MTEFKSFKGFITEPVGNSRTNNIFDVMKVKEQLHSLGFMPREDQPHGYITAEMDEGIKGFQKARGLNIDGWMQLGGETEKAMISNKKREDSFVNYDDKIKEYSFHENGAAHWGSFLNSPVNSLRAFIMRNKVDNDTAGVFPGVADQRNNEADAFRHTLWSYRLTKAIDEQTAKNFGDAHERENFKDKGNKKGQTLMDLDNNKMGRHLALDPRNKDRPDVDVIKEALKNGQLRVAPYKVEGEDNEMDYIVNKPVLWPTPFIPSRR